MRCLPPLLLVGLLSGCDLTLSGLRYDPVLGWDFGTWSLRDGNTVLWHSRGREAAREETARRRALAERQRERERERLRRQAEQRAAAWNTSGLPLTPEPEPAFNTSEWLKTGNRHKANAATGE